MVRVNVENGCYLFKLDDLLNGNNISKNQVMRDTNTDFKDVTKIDVMVYARLCDYLDCKLTDIVEYIPNNK